MSEYTTGTTSISPTRTNSTRQVQPLKAVGKYCGEKYQQMLSDIEDTDRRIKWLDQQFQSSPASMADHACKLQNRVMCNDTFKKMSEGLSDREKNTLAGAIATENSPLKRYVNPMLENMSAENNAFEQALKAGTKNMAKANFNSLNKVIKEAAKATGFSVETKILKQTGSISDIVFTDKKGRKFTAYSKINKDLNTSLTMDLEGFECNSNKCSRKMDEIISYLKSQGIPYEYKRFKHDQPQGILRKKLNEKSAKEKKDLTSYLQNGSPKLKSRKKLKR